MSAALDVGSLYDTRALQRRTEDFVSACFPGDPPSPQERGMRALEEMLWLVRALGVTQDHAQRLLGYVYARPVGEIRQEIGGAALALGAVASVVGADLGACWRTEVESAIGRIEQVRSKYQCKVSQGIAAPVRRGRGVCPHRGCTQSDGLPCAFAGCPQRVEADKPSTPPLDSAWFKTVNDRLRAAGFADADIAWSENAQPPEGADEFAHEAIFVICNSGMQNVVARSIYNRVVAALEVGQSATTVFRHPGKSAAIDRIWGERKTLFSAYQAAEDKLDFCGSLPWIGNITKYHLAKNFGVDVAKPDRHLVRLAALCGETPQALCDRLGRENHMRSATVDLLLWRACANRIVNPRTGEVLA